MSPLLLLALREHEHTFALTSLLILLKLHPRPTYDLVREQGKEEALGYGAGEGLVKLSLEHRSCKLVYTGYRIIVVIVWGWRFTVAEGGCCEYRLTRCSTC